MYDSIEEIGEGAFDDCPLLSKVTVKSASYQSFERVKRLLIEGEVREDVICMEEMWVGEVINGDMKGCCAVREDVICMQEMWVGDLNLDIHIQWKEE